MIISNIIITSFWGTGCYSYHNRDFTIKRKGRFIQTQTREDLVNKGDVQNQGLGCNLQLKILVLLLIILFPFILQLYQTIFPIDRYVKDLRFVV